jgi:hypothetical protein
MILVNLENREKGKLWEDKKRDSKSPDPRGHVGSIPTSGTNKNKGLKP